MKNILLTIICIFLSFSCLILPSCTKEGGDAEPETEIPAEPDQPAEPEKPEEPEKPQEPEKPATPDPQVYPEGLSVTENTFNHPDGKTTRYFVAKVNVKKNPNLLFQVLLNAPKKTPSQSYKDFDLKEKIPYILCNGGYFAGSTSVSLVVIRGFCEVVAPFDVSWPNYENVQQIIHPVRAAFGQMKDGTYHIDWVYCCDPAGRKHYSFPSALDNDEKKKNFMKDGPTPETPGAELWKPENAIGGGPMLVHKGKDVAMENYWKECFDSGGTAGASRVPRTGIGLDEEGNPIIIVCDGRGMKGSAGMTLSELAQAFIEAGAVSAMNLDGGGSSALVGKGGELLNWPSDSGASTTAKERKVVTTIGFALSLKKE